MDGIIIITKTIIKQMNMNSGILRLEIRFGSQIVEELNFNDWNF